MRRAATLAVSAVPAMLLAQAALAQAALAQAALAQAALAQADSLQGVWQYSRVNLRGENYSGNININANGSANDVTHRPGGADVAQSGTIKISGSNVEIVCEKAVSSTPPQYNPDHFYCTIQSDRAMSCSNTDIKGATSYQFALVRVGNPVRR